VWSPNRLAAKHQIENESKEGSFENRSKEGGNGLPNSHVISSGTGIFPAEHLQSSTPASQFVASRMRHIQRRLGYGDYDYRIQCEL
jgi:hypothetical protein